MLQFRAFARPLSVAIALLSSPFAWSAGADVPVVAASSQGTANANAAESNDASVIYFNPAGLARLHGTNFTQIGTLIAASSKVKDQGTTRVQDIGQGPETQDDLMSDPTPDPAMPAVGPAESFFPRVLPVGAVFGSMPYNDMITLGLGIFSPGGGNLNYKADWFGRYFADSAAIELININPSVGIRFDDKHSIGFGVSAIIGHAKIREQIDVNKIAPYLLAPVINQPGFIVGDLLTNLGLPGNVVSGLLNQLANASPQQVTDLLSGLLSGGTVPGVNLIDPNSTAYVTIETFGFGYGWNAGYMYQFDEKSRLSLSYRSESDVRMNGELDWNLDNLKGTLNDAPLIPVGGDTFTVKEFIEKYYRPDTDARIVLTIPSKLNIAYFRELTNKLDLMLSYTFNKTSAIQRLVVELPDQTSNVQSKQGNAMVRLNWRDTFTAAVGMNYHYNDKLTLRTGLQFDQTPVPSPEYRHPALADNDRWMGSVGLGYKIDKNTSIDLAYSYLYILDSEARYHDTCTGTYFENDSDGNGQNGPSECTSNGGTFRAKYYDSHAHILGAQINKRF